MAVPTQVVVEFVAEVEKFIRPVQRMIENTEKFHRDLTRAASAAKMPAVKEATQSLRRLGETADRVEELGISSEKARTRVARAATALASVSEDSLEASNRLGRLNRAALDSTYALKKAEIEGRDFLEIILDFGKVTSEARTETGRQMRWIGRDMIRLGSIADRVGGFFRGVIGSMARSSMMLGGVFEDVAMLMEDIWSSLGDTLGRILEPMVSLLEKVAEVVESLPEPMKAVIGVGMLAVIVFTKIFTAISSLVGILLLLRYGLVGVAKEAGVTMGAFSLLTGPFKLLIRMLTGTYDESLKYMRIASAIEKANEEATRIALKYADGHRELRDAIAKGADASKLYSIMQRRVTEASQREMAVMRRLSDIVKTGTKLQELSRKRIEESSSITKAFAKILRAPISILKGLFKAAKGAAEGLGTLALGFVGVGLIGATMEPMMRGLEPVFEALRDALEPIGDVLEGLVTRFLELPAPIKIAAGALLLFAVFGGKIHVICSGIITVVKSMIKLFTRLSASVRATGLTFKSLIGAAVATGMIAYGLGARLTPLGRAFTIAASGAQMLSWAMLALPEPFSKVAFAAMQVASYLMFMFGATRKQAEVSEELIDALASLGYEGSELYDVSEQIAAVWQSIQETYKDSTRRSIVLRERLEEMGFSLDEIAVIMKALDVQMVRTLDDFGTWADEIENLAARIGVSVKDILKAFSEWGIGAREIGWIMSVMREDTIRAISGCYDSIAALGYVIMRIVDQYRRAGMDIGVSSQDIASSIGSMALLAVSSYADIQRAVQECATRISNLGLVIGDLASAIGTTSQQIVNAFKRWGIDTPQEISLVIAGMTEDVIASIRACGDPIAGLAVLTEELVRRFLEGKISALDFASAAAQIGYRVEELRRHLAVDMAAMEEDMRRLSQVDLSVVIVRVREALDLEMPTILSYFALLGEALALSANTWYEWAMRVLESIRAVRDASREHERLEQVQEELRRTTEEVTRTWDVWLEYVKRGELTWEEYTEWARWAGGELRPPGYQLGGLVRRTGIYLLHAGEYVLPREIARELPIKVLEVPPLPPMEPRIVVTAPPPVVLPPVVAMEVPTTVNVNIASAYIRSEEDIDSLARNLSERIRMESRRAGVFS